MKQFSLALLIQTETASLQEVTVSSDVMIKQYNNSTLTRRKRQALIHPAFFWIPAQNSNPGNTAEVYIFY